jgi:glycerate 2-kinase
MKIKNVHKLIAAGDISARKVVLDVTEATLEALDSYHVITKLMDLDGDTLRIGKNFWNIGGKRRVYVIGAGKACYSMARAVENKLGDRINEGLVIVKQKETGDRLEKIRLIEGGHPTPNKNGFLASKQILDMVEDATQDDLFIGLISGGSSALMSFPIPGITLEDEIQLTEELLNSGARIQEINSVRRHISETNGGRLAQKVEEKGAEMINLIISDVVGEKHTLHPDKPVDFFGTPVAPDNTTLRDARNMLKKYDLHSRIPMSVVQFLEDEDPKRETPKSLGERIHHFVIQRPADACQAAQNAAKKLGHSAFILTTLLEGDSRQAGIFLACVAKELTLNHRPFSPPCILIAGGETTTRVDEKSGQGGPSQELALGFSLEVSNMNGISIVAIDTDGTDGPTEIAGGTADGATEERAREKGFDVHKYLKIHDSSGVLRALNDEVYTGNTGTNVCDLNIVYIA